MKQMQDLQSQKLLKDFNVLGCKLSQQEQIPRNTKSSHITHLQPFSYNIKMQVFSIKYMSEVAFLHFEINPMEILRTQESVGGREVSRSAEMCSRARDL